jgi:hypothetical protein
MSLLYDFLQGRTVLYHDFVFWCGDFNYRLNMSRDEVKAAVEVGNCHCSTPLVHPDPQIRMYPH